MKQTITVQAAVNAPIEKIWACWTEPEHIVNWCFASDDWRAPRAENDLKIGGRFLTRMESADGKTGFDFTGTYAVVEKFRRIEYSIGDGRKVQIEFAPQAGGC